MTRYEQIKAMRAGGMTTTQIAKELGMPPSTIRWSLGYSPKTRSHADSRARYRAIAADYASGMTIQDLMVKYTASKEVIHLARRKCGVPSRRSQKND
jgi:IS30 family transposase